jgi:hypothetical protein
VVPVAMVVVALVSTMCKGNVQDLLLLPFFWLVTCVLERQWKPATSAQ